MKGLRMDSQVQAHKFDETLLVTKAKKGGQVIRVILLKVNGGKLAIREDIAVDATSNIGQFSNPTLSRQFQVSFNQMVIPTNPWNPRMSVPSSLSCRFHPGRPSQTRNRD